MSDPAPTQTTVDPVTALLRLRVEVLRLACEIEALADERSIGRVRHHAPLVAERFRALVSKHEYREACQR